MGTRTPGCYLLVLELDRARAITVGRLGTFSFPPGWYVYAGSALGGLAQRICRHLRPSAVRHWHLDYLRAEAPVCALYVLPGHGHRECDLARRILALPAASMPAPRFGASDCRCPAHLARLPLGCYPLPALSARLVATCRLLSPICDFR